MVAISFPSVTVSHTEISPQSPTQIRDQIEKVVLVARYGFLRDRFSASSVLQPNVETNPRLGSAGSIVYEPMTTTSAPGWSANVARWIC